VKPIRALYAVGFSIITALFAAAGVAFVGFAILEFVHAVDPGQAFSTSERFSLVLESVGLLTIAVASFELSQTILEEEVLREAHMSAPTRVRRFLSRFLVVITVSLAIELLVAVFRLVHQDPAQLVPASAIGVATALLLASWGLFIWLNRSAEELEPEAMEEVKSEDETVQ